MYYYGDVYGTQLHLLVDTAEENTFVTNLKNLIRLGGITFDKVFVLLNEKETKSYKVFVNRLMKSQNLRSERFHIIQLSGIPSSSYNAIFRSIPFVESNTLPSGTLKNSFNSIEELSADSIIQEFALR
jgi:hypothetical protein